MQADEIDLNTVHCVHNSLGVALIKRDAGNRGRDLDTHGRYAHTNDVLVLQEDVRRYFWQIESELSQGCSHTSGVIRVDGNPNVEVVGGAGITVIADGVAPNQQIPNAMCAKQVQELFEVGR